MPIFHRTEVEIGKSLSKENTDQLEESLKKALADKQVDGFRKGGGQIRILFTNLGCTLYIVHHLQILRKAAEKSQKSAHFCSVNTQFAVNHIFPSF